MLLVTGAWAQKAPATMHLIVPFPPGGPVDFLGRVLADGLRTQLKNIVVVENRPGANGAVAIAALRQAEPDGGTLLVVSSGMITFSPYFEKKLSYDPDRDLVPVVNAAYADVGLVVANKIPATNLREFVALARSSPKPLAMASAGTGNITHAYLELF
ncbi:MAG TPA: tripartite tricarboxylate transporter substrate-binding protein, partial [Candidatus Binatia bacterium]|nr:tripartite tricarboxylate transporter substrate-binding protein [Candidatus Binatia bacterium]